MNTLTHHRSALNQNRVVDERVELVGRRVSMMGSVWPGQDPNKRFYGVVTKRMKFKDRKGEVVDGYEVLWEDGERERWPYDYLIVALVMREELIHDSDSDDSDSEESSSSDSDESSSDATDDCDDVLSLMAEHEDPEGFEYQQVFCTSNTGEDILVAVNSG